MRQALAQDDELQAKLQEIFDRYEGERGDLIPVLQGVQDAVGYIPREAMSATARFLGVPEAVVHGVTTFYAQFNLTRQGRRRVKVCLGTACHVRGGARILEAIGQKLGIQPGETTEDFEFSVERVACFGSCALSPVVMIDGKVHGRMTPQKAVDLLESVE